MIVASGPIRQIDVDPTLARIGFGEGEKRAGAGRRQLMLDRTPAFELSYWCGTCPASTRTVGRPSGRRHWLAGLVRSFRIRTPRLTQMLTACADAGLNDLEIFEATTFIAVRLAFSTVNDALGARPDEQLAEKAPRLVRKAVDFGRPV